MGVGMQMGEDMGQYLYNEVSDEPIPLVSGNRVLTIGKVLNLRTIILRVGSLDDPETQRLLWSRRSQGILVLGDALTGSRRKASGAGSEVQAAKLLVEVMGIDAIERIATGLGGKERRGTAGGACAMRAGEAARVMLMGAILEGLGEDGRVTGLKMLF